MARGLPDPPRSVIASARDASAVVGWSAPEADGGAPITGYLVTAYPGGHTARVSGSTREATVSGLRNGVQYGFTVAAETEVGRGRESVASNIVTPATEPQPPGGVHASAIAAGQVRLEWDPPRDDGGVPIERYEVCVVGGSCKTVPGTQTSTVFDGLGSGQAVAFTVVAVNEAGKRSSSSARSGDVVPELPPTVRLVKAPAAGAVTGADVALEFDATPARARAICVLDGAPFSCASPLALRDLAEGAHAFTVIAASAAGEARSETRHWTVDRTPPQAQITRLPVLVTRGRAAVGYAGRDTGGAQQRAFELRVRRAGLRGAFDDYSIETDITAEHQRSRDVPLTAGQTACVSVRARDSVGNVSAWPAERCVTHALDDKALGRKGRWRNVKRSGLVGGRALQTARRGARLTTHIGKADRLTVIVPRCQRCGRLRIELDGRTIRTLRLSSRSRARSPRRIAVPLPAANRGGRLELVAAGGKVVIDAVGVHRLP